MTTEWRVRGPTGCRALVAGLGCLGLCLPVRGQQGSDWLAWGSAGVRLRPDSASRWQAEGTYQHLTYQNAARTFLRLGTAHVTYFLPRHGLAFSPGYLFGHLDRQGRVQVVQMRLQQALPTWALRPRWQLTLDRLWLTPRVRDGLARAPLHRVRYLVGVEPALTKRLDLVLNTELFLYRTPTWCQEVRSQGGVRWQPGARLIVQLLYWNRWRGYPARTTWEHSPMLTAVVIIKGAK